MGPVEFMVAGVTFRCVGAGRRGEVMVLAVEGAVDDVQGGVGGVQSSVDSGAGVTPDLFAGELDAMGRLLHDVAGKLARRALHTQDLQVAAKHVADELRAMALLLVDKCGSGEKTKPLHPLDVQALCKQLLEASESLTKALAKLDEREV